jgi:hypothetical protein
MPGCTQTSPSSSRPARNRPPAQPAGGFTGAVAPDQRNALARVEQKISVIEERHVAVGKAGIREF